jgi:hypothetical protein
MHMSCFPDGASSEWPAGRLATCGTFFQPRGTPRQPFASYEKPRKGARAGTQHKLVERWHTWSLAIQPLRAGAVAFSTKNLALVATIYTTQMIIWLSPSPSHNMMLPGRHLSAARLAWYPHEPTTLPSNQNL